MTGSSRALDAVPGLRALLARQHDVVTRQQLAALGVTKDHVRCQYAAARWQAVSEQVIVTHRGPLSRSARLWVAVLGAPSGSVIGALTALDLLGLRGWGRDGVHVVVPRGATVERYPWLVVHESRRLRSDHVVDVGGLQAHCVERAAVDAAAWQPSWRTAAGLMAAVVQQGLTTVERMHTMLDEVGAVRHRRVSREALADIAGGADSLAEIDFARLCRAASLPEPTRQSVRLDARGRRRFLDVEWRLGGGRRLVVEIDGIGHMERDRWYDDLLRDAEIGADARTIRIRLPAMAARYEPDRVAAIVRHHLFGTR
ncbi:hypothetical protein [Xylanimonas sp. McL0601]|uniref:hypothetical protein n=1 Tax=Xylanimonas sp. McL0601 TaxID=3414739 RepID=UPI003CF8D05F